MAPGNTPAPRPPSFFSEIPTDPIEDPLATQPRQRGVSEDSSLKRGLPSIEKAREARNKRVRPPFKVMVWFGVVLVLGTAAYWYRSASNVENERAKLMADQRAVEAELGKRWYPLREQIESKTLELAKEDLPDVVEKEELSKFRFQDKPGIYLRVRLDQAKSVETLRAAAKDSLRDGLTSCLMRTAGPSPLEGPACASFRECKSGEICNDLGHCSLPTQPYNLRLAYKTMYVLTPEWVKDVQDATDDMRVRALRLSFDDATKSDLPVAVDLVTRAAFFMAVVDERPAPAKPPAPASTGTGASDAPTPEDLDVIDGHVYPSRIAVWRLSDGKLLLRLKREPAGGALLGGQPAKDPASEAARLRQAQSCSLALEVRKAIGDDVVGPKALEPAPGDSGSPKPAESAVPSASAVPAESAVPSSSAVPSASAVPSKP